MKPCPFCGGSEKFPARPIKLSVPWAKTTYTVECDNCQATCGYEDTEQDAIDRWNDRTVKSMEENKC